MPWSRAECQCWSRTAVASDTHRLRIVGTHSKLEISVVLRSLMHPLWMRVTNLVSELLARVCKTDCIRLYRHQISVCIALPAFSLDHQQRDAYLLEGGTDSPQLATPVTVLAGCLGVSQHLIGTSQVSFVALTLPLRHHDRQHHLRSRWNEARHLGACPSEHVCVQSLGHLILMLLLSC